MDTDIFVLHAFREGPGDLQSVYEATRDAMAYAKLYTQFPPPGVCALYSSLTFLTFLIVPLPYQGFAGIAALGIARTFTSISARKEVAEINSALAGVDASLQGNKTAV